MNVDPKDLRRILADHIRAIRYLRLRNEEVATMDVLYRLQQHIRARLQSESHGPGHTTQQRTAAAAARRNKTVKLVQWKPND